jgi:hypothetical protein
MIMKDLGIKQGADCDNWVRHRGLYVPKSVLDRGNIHYCQFQQSVGQVVITFPLVYHQGFNSGPNVAEAVNYGDRDWNMEGRKLCTKRRCGYDGTHISAFQPRSTGQVQGQAVFANPADADPPVDTVREVEEDNSDSGASLPDKSQTPGKASKGVKRKKRNATTQQPKRPVPQQMGMTLRNKKKEAPGLEAGKSAKYDKDTVPPEEQYSARWSTWEEEQRKLTETPKLRPSVIYNDLKTVNIETLGNRRPLTLQEAAQVTTLIAAFGSAAAFFSLRICLRNLGTFKEFLLRSSGRLLLVELLRIFKLLI